MLKDQNLKKENMMKKFCVGVSSIILVLGMSSLASAQTPEGYTLDDIYYYLVNGTEGIAGDHSMEPPADATPGDARFHSLNDIYTQMVGAFDQCDATALDVEGGKKFFCAVAENWGVQTGTRTGGAIIVTGQRFSFQTGDDGYYQKGIAYDYVDNGDGTITDNATGLMWAKDGLGLGCNNGNPMTWSNAITWAEELVFPTYSDWRIPNIHEMYSLMINDHTMIPGLLINETFFPNSQSSYLTSTTHPLYTDYYYYVQFDGHIYRGIKETPGAGFNVRVVRGGK
jgi:Protein of unknown function (DUF1566)